jgi:hypothetical protein
MENIPNTHLHPESQVPIIGKKLEPGDIIGTSDVFSAHNGLWKTSPDFPGQPVVEGSKYIWIRPTIVLLK